jgi:hypothetical protein
MTVEQIARICHEANRSYCEGIGDESQTHWLTAPQWQKDSAIKGVQFKLDNPTATPEAQHQCWLEQKRIDGWKYGSVKDASKKEHPCFVPYEQLPKEQQLKDHLFAAVVETFRHHVGV